jgi:hypothetical protein
LSHVTSIRQWLSDQPSSEASGPETAHFRQFASTSPAVLKSRLRAVQVSADIRDITAKLEQRAALAKQRDEYLADEARLDAELKACESCNVARNYFTFGPVDRLKSTFPARS